MNKCPFCDWTTKERGVWKNHYVLRQHMQGAHPKQYATLEQEEAEVRERISVLRTVYGISTLLRY